MKKLNAYEEVAEEILNRINNNTYSTAQRLPSEYDLAKDFQVSRLTVRKAVEVLVNNNRLMKNKGKGTYIISQEKISSGSLGLLGFTEVAKERGMIPKTKVIGFVDAHVPPTAIQQALKLDMDAKVYLIKRLRLADEEPLIIEELYVPVQFLPRVTKANLEQNSIFALIEDVVDIGYSHQEVGADLVTKEQSELLEVPENVPILQVNSVTYSITSIPILFDTSYYRADKYTFKTTLQRNR